MRRTWLTAIAAASCLGVAASPAGGVERAKGPDVIQLSYSESDDGTSPPFALQAFAYRVDALRFTTRYAGERASGEAKYDDGITDTNIHAHGEARHPWKLIRRGEGKEVTRLIRDSLAARGEAKVRVRARGHGEHEDIAVVIELSKCSQDPPFYPVDCEVKV